MDRHEPGSLDESFEHEVAIIGMAGRFPGARNIDEFWQNLRDGVESIAFFSDEELLAAGVDAVKLSNPQYVKAQGALEGIEFFDAAFFGYSPKDAQIIDPQQRIFLEEAWLALEHAGYNPETYQERIGVFAGTSMSSYLLYHLYPNDELMHTQGPYQMLLGNDKDYLATRVSYKLHLKGPGVTVQTACSTSLVAVHMACQSILNGECEMALAGGVSVRSTQKGGYFYQEGGILSPDGHCRAFDARAQGTVGGSGVGVVVLKRLADAIHDGDTIYAVIKGSAINNDGYMKSGYTAPSIEGQAEVIAEALAMARVEVEEVSYVETHGTATPLGDPIEIAALTQVYQSQTAAKAFCALGSVKTNIGHLDAAAGVAGLLKTVLALKHRQLPPSLHFHSPNPRIDFADSPFFINATLTSWKTPGHRPRIAGVSSFGIGGTNAHVVLQEAPLIQVPAQEYPWHLLVLSARTSTALEQVTTNLIEHLKLHPELNFADVAYTCQVGRKAFDHQRILVCRDKDDALQALERRDPQRVLTLVRKPGNVPVVFLFPGQGAQYLFMAEELYRLEPAFRAQVDRCCELLRPHLDLYLRYVLYPREQDAGEMARRLQQSALAQPALFVIEYALAQLWMQWGVEPQAMLGHSFGEYVAACLADVFTLEEALALVALRGRLTQDLPTGAMLSVSLSEQALRAELDARLSIAAINGPSECVVSGPHKNVSALQLLLESRNIPCRLLQTSHAFHSQMMEPILGQFADKISHIQLKPPKIPYISNVSGTWITYEEATSPHYWASHLRQTVQFAAGVGELFKMSEPLFLEVGPGQTLSSLLKRNAQPTQKPIILSSLRRAQQEQSDLAFLLETMGKLWLAGIPLDWSQFYAHQQRRRLPLPGYPFERQRYWIEPPGATSKHIDEQTPVNKQQEVASEAIRTESDSAHSRPDLLIPYAAPENELERTLAAIWQEVLGISQVGRYDDFFELGGHSLLATQLISRLREAFPIEIALGELLKSTTIAGQAEIIEMLLVEQIATLSEDEIQRLL